MKHESFNKVIEVSNTDITFEKVYMKDYVPAEFIDEIKMANLLIIPHENFREKGDILFPETTREFFEYIKENSGDQVVADITISDEDFRLIELHSAVIEVATVIVDYAILPVAIGIISNYLYDLIKKYRRTPEETSARVKIVSEETKTKKSKMITYEGPVSGIKDALEQASKDLFSEK